MVVIVVAAPTTGDINCHKGREVEDMKGNDEDNAATAADDAAPVDIPNTDSISEEDNNVDGTVAAAASIDDSESISNVVVANSV